MKKAQLAVETLLIYGIALLIVMLAIGALISFGILDLSGLLPNTCKVNGVELTCANYYFSKSQGFTLELTNNIGENIEMLKLVSVKPINKNDQGVLEYCDMLNFPFKKQGPQNNLVDVSSTNILVNGENAYVQSKTNPNQNQFCRPVNKVKSGKKIGVEFQLEYKKVGMVTSTLAKGTMQVSIVD